MNVTNHLKIHQTLNYNVAPYEGIYDESLQNAHSDFGGFVLFSSARALFADGGLVLEGIL